MRLIKAFGMVLMIIIFASCKDEGISTIGRYISEDDTAYSADIISASKKINADPENAELYYLRGNAFYFLDQFSDAEIDFSTAIKLDSFNALYNYKLGDCILNMDTSNLLALALLTQSSQSRTSGNVQTEWCPSWGVCR